MSCTILICRFFLPLHEWIWFSISKIWRRGIIIFIILIDSLFLIISLLFLRQIFTLILEHSWRRCIKILISIIIIIIYGLFSKLSVNLWLFINLLRGEWVMLVAGIYLSWYLSIIVFLVLFGLLFFRMLVLILIPSSTHKIRECLK